MAADISLGFSLGVLASNPSAAKARTKMEIRMARLCFAEAVPLQNHVLQNTPLDHALQNTRLKPHKRNLFPERVHNSSAGAALIRIFDISLHREIFAKAMQRD